MSKNEGVRNTQFPERERGFDKNPKITTLLGSAGLTAVDFQLFDRLYQQGQSVFVHGSIMADRITPHSDIDFTVIGEMAEISPELRSTLMPGIDAALEMRDIDYISTSVRSQDGRKISMHVSEPEFRANHPVLDKPYATEYRPGIHAKSSARKYFLSSTTRDGDVRLINFLCDSENVGTDGSTVTDIPQTGRLTLRGDTVFMQGKKKHNMIAEQVIRVRADGREDTTPSMEAEDLMILGLEFDKMQSDTSMYSDSVAEQQYVTDPIKRSMEALGEFSATDPAIITNRLFSELAKHWRKVKPNKSR